MSKDEQDAWMARSEALVQKIIEKFWDGEKWIAFNPATGAKSTTLNISLYMPLLLGKRLPQEIIDKSIETIFSPDGFDTPYGLASEGLTSDFFRHGFTGGSVITPAQFLMVLAFEACGRPDLAKKVAVNYCRAMKNHGFFHIYNALTGEETAASPPSASAGCSGRRGPPPASSTSPTATGTAPKAFKTRRHPRGALRSA